MAATYSIWPNLMLPMNTINIWTVWTGMTSSKWSILLAVIARRHDIHFSFILNCAMVNAFIIFSNESQRRNSKKRFTRGLQNRIGSTPNRWFFWQKKKVYWEPWSCTWAPKNLPIWEQNEDAEYTWTERKEKRLFMDAKCAMHICAKMDATLHTILHSNMKKQTNNQRKRKL